MIVFQHIETDWTKADRGARGRELRARLPVSYPVPDGLLASRRRCVLHQIRRYAGQGYAPSSREEDIVHVAFDAPLSTSMFASPPDQTLERRVDLW